MDQIITENGVEKLEVTSVKKLEKQEIKENVNVWENEVEIRKTRLEEAKAILASWKAKLQLFKQD